MRTLLLLGLASVLAAPTANGQETSLRESLLFHASFDNSPDADFAKGDRRIYTAKSLKRNEVRPGLHSSVVSLRPTGGKYGGCLSFSGKDNAIIFFQGAGNLPKRKESFDGAITFWMSLNPDKDLPPGFVDPLQITDKKWNDASFFVDFTKASPRQFRLGAYSDYAFWNPEARKYEEIPDSERPLVPVAKPPFRSDRWTHVAICFADFNRQDKEGAATLYLDGKSQGAIRGKQRFTWNDERLAIMLGIYYVGGIDDFAVFDRSLTAAEVGKIANSKADLGSLR